MQTADPSGTEQDCMWCEETFTGAASDYCPKCTANPNRTNMLPANCRAAHCYNETVRPSGLCHDHEALAREDATRRWYDAREITT